MECSGGKERNTEPSAKRSSVTYICICNIHMYLCLCIICNVRMYRCICIHTHVHVCMYANESHTVSTCAYKDV